MISMNRKKTRDQTQPMEEKNKNVSHFTFNHFLTLFDISCVQIRCTHAPKIDQFDIRSQTPAARCKTNTKKTKRFIEGGKKITDTVRCTFGRGVYLTDFVCPYRMRTEHTTKIANLMALTREFLVEFMHTINGHTYCFQRLVFSGTQLLFRMRKIEFYCVGVLVLGRDDNHQTTIYSLFNEIM